MRTVQFTEERLVIFLNSIKFSGIDTGGTLEDVLNKFNEKHGNSLPAGTVFNAVRFLKDRGLLGNVQDELNFQDELKENFLNCNYVLSPAAAQGPGGAGAMAAAAAGGGGGGAAAAVAPAMAPAPTTVATSPLSSIARVSANSTRWCTSRTPVRCCTFARFFRPSRRQASTGSIYVSTRLSA